MSSAVSKAARMRAIANTQNTMRVRKLAKATFLGGVDRSIDEIRRMVREECARPLEMMAVRMPVASRTRSVRDVLDDILNENNEQEGEACDVCESEDNDGDIATIGAL